MEPAEYQSDSDNARPASQVRVVVEDEEERVRRESLALTRGVVVDGRFRGKPSVGDGEVVEYGNPGVQQ